jgi:glycosyltransferase involved in cell wall biosynthesis/SAM-dependent methyltransferase
MDDMDAPSHLADHQRLAAPSRYAAVVVANILDRWIETKSVLDLGCGTGTWLRGFAASGRREVFGVEGEHLDLQHLEIDPELILHADLGQQIDLRRRFDLVLCLEVAEHIASESAGTVVDNCIRHADIVLFSAALPGQQGRRHVNEQLPEYWVALFRSRGFVVFDVIRPLIWDDGNIPIWYRQNTLLFVREDLQVAATLQMEAERVAAAMPLNRAHPDLLKWFSHEATLAKQASADATKANHDLQRRLADTTARLTAASRRAEGELQRANSALAVLRQEREIIFNSTIWRMTGPLRSAGRKVPVPVRRMLRRVLQSMAALRQIPRPAPTAGSAKASASAGLFGSPESWRIVVVSGEPHNPGHFYRVVRFAEAAKAVGASVLSITLPELAAHHRDLVAADLVMIWRAANTPEVAAGIEAIRTGNGKLLVDVDDLMFVPELASETIIDGIRSQNLDAAGVAEFFVRVREVMAAADACICTTNELAMYVRQLEKVTFVLPNGFDSGMHAAARLAVRRRRALQDDGMIRIGYAAGTRTHQRDFAVAADALARILQQFPSCRLVLFRDPATGHSVLDAGEFPTLQAQADQIEWRDLVPLSELPDELSRFDINLAPLEIGNAFCEAKSELKYFEAALAGVCTIASATGPMRRAIRDGETGRLADGPEDWYAALRDLIGDAGLRHRLAHAAYLDVLWRFGPVRRQDLLFSMVQQLRGGPEGARAFELQWLRDTASANRLPDTPEAETVYAADKLGLAEVTVAIPLYNYANYIEEALESVRAQTLAAIDLVVVDDASTDHSLDVALAWVRRHADRFNRVLVMCNRSNSGLARTRNVGFDAAETHYVLPLDADNRLRPESCEKSLAALQGGRAAFAYPKIQCFGGSDHVIGAQPFEPLRLASNNYIDAMALIAKWAWAAIGGYEHIKFGWEDYDFWCRCVERGIWGVHVPEILADYRFHETSMLRTSTDIPKNKQLVVSTLESRHPWLSILPDQPAD